MKKRLIFALIVVFALSFVLMSSTKEKSPGADEAAVKDTIVWGFAHNARSFDPAIMISGQESSINNSIYDCLTAYNKDDPGDFLPELAERWDVNSDATEWTFYLRKGVKFTTGNEVTAEDVVYSLRRGIEQNSPVYPPLKNFINPNTGFEIIDNYTVKMKLNVGFGGWAGMLSRSSCGVLDKDELEKHITSDDPLGSAFLNDTSIGSGPFYLKEWARNERIVLEKNDNYWGIKAGYHRVPKYQTFICLHVPESATQEMMLRNGDIDMTFSLPKAALEGMRGKPGIRIDKIPAFIFTGILMNPQFAPFSDVNVRQAVKYALDYESLVNDVFVAVRLDRPIGKPAVGTDNDYIYSYDLAKAKSLMAKSRYPDGFDVVLNIGTGIGLGADWETAGLKIADDLSKIGINAKLQQNEWSVQDEKLFSANYEAELNWFGPSFADTEGHLYVLGRVDSVHLGPMGWNNPDITRLADKGKAETDPAKRYEIYRELSEIFAVDGPFAPIAQETSQFAFRENIQGWDGNPDYYGMDFSVIYVE